MPQPMTERQQRLYDALRHAAEPVTGADLSTRLGVTRQVVVHDVALLRAQGINVLSTPRGYLLYSADTTPIPSYVLSVTHPPELTAIELYTMVDYGLRVVDVQIAHPVYGELKGSLLLASRRDVDLFLSQIETSDAMLLSSLTDGHHLHTVQCSEETRLSECIQVLRQQGIQVFQ